MDYEKKQKLYDSILLAFGLILSAVILFCVYLTMDKSLISQAISEIVYWLNYAIVVIYDALPFKDMSDGLRYFIGFICYFGLLAFSYIIVHKEDNHD